MRKGIMAFFFFLHFYLESVANKDREHMKNMLCVMDEGSLWPVELILRWP